MRFASEPTVLVAFIEVVVGVLMLARAADEFVDGAARVASRARISPVLVGAVIVGFGTSAPELLVSTLAANAGDVDLGIGNIVGSNVANLSLVLGTAALLVPVLVTRSVLVREAPLSLLAVLLFAFLASVGGLSRLDGILLGVALVGALSWIIIGGRVPNGRDLALATDSPPARRAANDGPTTTRAANEGTTTTARAADGGPAPTLPAHRAATDADPDEDGGDGGSDSQPHGDGDGEPNGNDFSDHQPGDTPGLDLGDEEGSLRVEALRTVIGLIGTVLGAQLLVWGAMAIADEFNMTGGFVGFTLVAVGTSLPELMTAVAAARRGATDLLLGNLLGSNIFNSLAVGSAIALVGPGPMSDEGLRTIGLLVMVGVAVGAWVAMATRKRVHHVEGAVLLVAWVVAVVLLARTGTEAVLGSLRSF